MTYLPLEEFLGHVLVAKGFCLSFNKRKHDYINAQMSPL